MFTFPITLFGGGITVISFFDSATSTASTITAPASINAGDAIILFDRPVSSGTPPSTVPTNFISIGDNVNTNLRSILSYKLALGTEGGTSITGANGSTSNQKVMLVFRGNTAASLITISSFVGQATTGNPTAQVVPLTGQPAPLVVFGIYSANGSISGANRVMTPTKDAEFDAVNSAWIAYTIYNSAPTDTTVDMGAVSTQNILQSFYLTMTA